eukprot:TRINITY_DN3347_c0_g4_i2.p3 TRINITY_DN3347_c0_g4~~TRINITY_DN3347_c0_g4_i2.p3  ORF type:complete len:121 (-),score=46.48 TRINITY_DN3347_c0_g4_i2:253-615(-)
MSFSASGAIYEVTSSVPQADGKDYHQWLIQHTEDLLKVNCFTSRDIYHVASDDASRAQFVVHYRADSKAKVDEYLEKHSGVLREEALKRWGDKLSASRRILIFESSARAQVSSSSLGYIH